MLHAAWPTGGTFYDISSVFQVNGLAPQTFKPQPYRSSTRPRKQSRASAQGDPPTQSSSQGSSRQGTQLPPPVSPQGTPKSNTGTSRNVPIMGGDTPRITAMHHTHDENRTTSSAHIGKFCLSNPR